MPVSACAAFSPRERTSGIQEYLKEADKLAELAGDRLNLARVYIAAAPCCRMGATCQAPSNSAGRRSISCSKAATGRDRRRRLRARPGAVVFRRPRRCAAGAGAKIRMRGAKAASDAARPPSCCRRWCSSAIWRASAGDRATAPPVSTRSRKRAPSPTGTAMPSTGAGDSYEGALLLAGGNCRGRSTYSSARSASRAQMKSSGISR